MEQEGQGSQAFRLKERTGDGEVKAARSRDPRGGQEDLEGRFEVIRSENGGLQKRLTPVIQCRSYA